MSVAAAGLAKGLEMVDLAARGRLVGASLMAVGAQAQAEAAAPVAPTHSVCSSGSHHTPAYQSRTLRAQAGATPGSTRQTHRSTQGMRQRCCRSPSSSPHPPSESKAVVLVWAAAMETQTVAAWAVVTVAAVEMWRVVAMETWTEAAKEKTCERVEMVTPRAMAMG